MVLSEGTTFPGLVLPTIPIGVVELEQNRKQGGGRERNDRLLAVALDAPRSEARDAKDLPERVRSEIERFFIDPTFFEDKHAVILGWGGPAEAWALVRASLLAPVC